MAYGFQCFDSSGRLTCDNTSIMSQVKGTLDLPFMTQGNGWVVSAGEKKTNKWTYVISNCDFSNGTPYVFFVPTTNTVPSGSVFAYSLPDVTIGSNFISLEYNYMNLAYPDDLGGPLVGGGLTVVWGVYNG
ncbi:hypothetical protein UXO11_21290 [Enterobacter wuhouensis]|uniref:hypothetical protein n=1 Tax=Enterobacter wuhouensis TaxID=2529381 RepID=UPI002FD248CC